MKTLSLLALASSTLLLASCGTKTPPASDLKTLTGTVVEGGYEGTSETNSRLVTSAWSGGAGTVNGYLIVENAPTAQPAVTGTLAADGKFSLTLPTPTDAQLTAIDPSLWQDFDETGFADACVPQVTVSGTGVRSTFLTLTVDAAKDGPVSPASYSSSDVAGQGQLSASLGGLIYVDRALTVKGSRSCTVEGITVKTEIDLRLGKGWNKMQFAVSANEASKTATSTLKSGSFGPDTWVYMESGMSPLSLGSKLPKPGFLGR